MDRDPPGAVASLSTTLGLLDIAKDETLSSSAKIVAPKSSGRLSDVAHVRSFPLGPIRRVSRTGLRESTVGSRPSVATTVSNKPDNEIAPAPLTAASVASTFFNKELALHDESEVKTDTVVVLHDDCYLHRWSRPKTSKVTLGLVVERPERLQAAVRGVAAAYILLGGKHSGGANAPHSKRESSHDIPFRIKRTSRLLPLTSNAPVNIHGLKWMKELQMMCESAEGKLAMGQKEVGRTEELGQSAKTKLHDGDLYLCRDSLDTLQGALGGVIDGVDAVFTRHRKAFVCIRPPGHHCSADLPSGFCWINNVHVGIEHAVLTHGLTHAAIIDFDLHHGDGSQAITWARNTKSSKATKRGLPADRTSIGYFSLHDINSYPCEHGDADKVQSASLCIENAHAQTIWNVHLQPWGSKAEFWQHYEQRYIVLLDKARQYLRSQTERIKLTQPGVEPKAMIFISAGFDASEWESEGMQRHKVNVPTDFYAKFTEDIIQIARQEGTSVDGRVVSVLEGGYSDRALTSGILSHLVGLTASTSHYSGAMVAPLTKKRANCHSDWWNLKSLTELEETFLSPSIATAKEARSAEPQAFWSPTRSFSAKVVDPSKLYRSISGTIAPTRSPTPPPPEVEWSIATHELCKLLVPSDRQIDSCKYEELAEVKVKRERISNIMPPPQVPGDRMQLRGRRSGVGFDAGPGTIPFSHKDVPSELPSRQATLGIAAVRAAKIATVKLPPTSDQPSVAVRKSRRISGAFPDLLSSRRVSSSAPVETLPSQPPASNVDSLTAGMKKITLRYNGPKDTEVPVLKPAKKAAIPKQPKPSSTAKTAAIKSTASQPVPHVVHSNTAASLSTVGSASNVQTAAPVIKLEDTSEDTRISSHQAISDRFDSVQFTAAISVNTHPVTIPLVSSEERIESASTSISSTSLPASLPSTALSVAPVESAFSMAFLQSPTDTSSPSLAPHSKSETKLPQPFTSQTPAEPNLFIPYIPESDPHYGYANTQASKPNGLANLTWLPPNTATPTASPAPKRVAQEAARLPPVFTSDGHIPFAGAERR